MMRSESIGKVATAYAKARGLFPRIAKDSVNPHFKSRYADLATILEAVTPILSECGLALLQPTTETEHGCLVETYLIHGESGEFIGSSYAVKVANRDDAQGKGAGLTYARRFALSSLLGIAADDDDDGHQASQPPRQNKREEQQLAKQQAPQTYAQWSRKAADKLGMDVAAFNRAMFALACVSGWTSHELPAAERGSALAGCWEVHRTPMIAEAKRLSEMQSAVAA